MMTRHEKILKLSAVIEQTGLTRNKITQKINNGTFPKPFKLNKQNAWLETEINYWLKKEKLKNLLKQIILWLLGKIVYSFIENQITD
jgi:predicted DNA-binding transcriptional regulator AlpA